MSKKELREEGALKANRKSPRKRRPPTLQVKRLKKGEKGDERGKKCLRPGKGWGEELSAAGGKRALKKPALVGGLARRNQNGKRSGSQAMKLQKSVYKKQPGC